MNYLGTALLLAALTGFFLASAVCWVAGGLMFALVVALGMNVLATGTPTRWCCAWPTRTGGPTRRPSSTASSSNSRRAAACRCRGLLIDEDQPNAFATGRNPEHAAVAATTGLLRHLSREEVRRAGA